MIFSIGPFFTWPVPYLLILHLVRDNDNSWSFLLRLLLRCNENSVRQTSDEAALPSCETRELSKEWILDKLWDSSEKPHNFLIVLRGPQWPDCRILLGEARGMLKRRGCDKWSLNQSQQCSLVMKMPWTSHPRSVLTSLSSTLCHGQCHLHA